MAIIYEIVQSKLPDKEGRKLFHPRAIHLQTVTTPRIAQEVAAYCSLTPGDVQNAIDGLVTVMTQHLQASECVKLDGMGTFRIVMLSQRKGATSAKMASASQSRLTVRFVPAFTRKANRKPHKRAMVTGATCRQLDTATGALAPEEKPVAN